MSRTPGGAGLFPGFARKFTTDFRFPYATVLDRWVGAPADDILGEHFDPVAGLVA